MRMLARPAALGALLLTLSGCGSPEPANPQPAGSTTAAATTAAAGFGTASADAEAAESKTGKIHLKAGEKAEAAAEGTAIEVTVADPKVIKAPDGWGDGNIIIATVTYNLLDGQVEYDETAFTLVLADGERIDASTVASDTGLPGRALGSGPLTAPDKAKGLITFDHDTKSLDGLRIQWTASPAGFTWTLN
ncbi:hypothetical protein AB0F81_20195 [Actinoplanes sp. NPDC024001]|uniref:hypothetical protein n=1 Tax=Actinoplanes sp. NPDC024001 TaxID=3154598 RepID=UPI0034069566